jgi:hypothetical protein
VKGSGDSLGSQERVLSQPTNHGCPPRGWPLLSAIDKCSCLPFQHPEALCEDFSDSTDIMHEDLLNPGSQMKLRGKGPQLDLVYLSISSGLLLDHRYLSLIISFLICYGNKFVFQG